MSGNDKRKHGPLIGAIDQGTSSSRFLVFKANGGELLTYYQVEIGCSFPHEGWVEQDPMEIFQSVQSCIEKTVENLHRLDIDPCDIITIGITNQRETTIAWDSQTGKPLFKAIVWSDTRTDSLVDSLIMKTPAKDKYHWRQRTGLPINTYFSALKMLWLLENSQDVKDAVKKGTCLFGTVDSWLIWNLTGGVGKGVHITDVTNASRTLLLNINSLQWDSDLCKFFHVNEKMLPKVRSSSEIYGYLAEGPLRGVPISGCIGDQQGSLVGQNCLKEGDTKNTYGTGCFLLSNTGTKVVISEHGLLTTVAYQIGRQKPVYALEGSIAVAGAAVKWLRDNLGIVKTSSEVEDLANSVLDNGGCYFVPAFSGLFAPHWRMDARGIICGMTQYTTKGHIARAALEAVCFQTRDIMEVMKKDSGIQLPHLWANGGMTHNNLLMQLQADILGIPIERPGMVETTALGAAIMAGMAEGVNVWKPKPSSEVTHSDVFHPKFTDDERDILYEQWKVAVERSFGWEKYGEKRKSGTKGAIPGKVPA